MQRKDKLSRNKFNVDFTHKQVPLPVSKIVICRKETPSTWDVMFESAACVGVPCESALSKTTSSGAATGKGGSDVRATLLGIPSVCFIF